ncbi:MAG: DUF131 domain-containing protein [Nitrososphaerota archaeon]|nr:DUF131 domain-containing protein [Candidatus Geocrenenecus dongiae]
MANIFFITIGLIFILLGILLLMLSLQAKSRNKVKSYSFGFILLGPFPIFFSGRRLLTIVLMVTLIFMIFLIIVFMGEI